MKTLRTLAVALLLAFAVTPADAQIDNPNQSTPTTLYFHIFDTFNKFVINTQEMNTEFFEVGGTNFPTLDGTIVNQVYGSNFDFNTIYGTSTAGPVEYDFIENGRPRFHPERGIAADVQIDGGVQPVSYIYLDVRDITGTDSLSNALPEFHVRVTMRTGDDPGPDAELDAGTEIMSGEVNGWLCDDGEDIPIPITAVCGGLGDMYPVDSDGIVEVAIPMEVASGVIPKTDAFNVRIDWWQTTPDGTICGEDMCAEGYMRLSASQEKQPRLEMAVLNPVYIEFIHPQVAAGTLLIHTGVNSPWGTYDIDAANITLSVSGPSTPQSLQQVVAQNQHVHGLHDKAAEITYLWKFRDEDAANGEYTITMDVPNGRGNAVASGTAGFAIEGKKAFGISDEGEVVEPTATEGSEGSPSIGFLGAIALLGAALLLRRK